MKALLANRTDRVVFYSTIVSGILFIACVGLMATSFKPIFKDKALAESVNQQVISEIKASTAEVQKLLVMVPVMVEQPFVQELNGTILPKSIDFNQPLNGVIDLGKSLVTSEK